MKSRFLFRCCLCALLGWILLFGAFVSAQQESSGPREGLATQTSGSYEIRPLDVLRVSLFVADEVQFSSEVRVSQDGAVSLPYIGNFQIAGKTLDQVRFELFEPYNRDYYVEPYIDIVVLAYAERSVTVIGKVNRQGPVPFPSEEELTLLEAIARAGGWSNDRLADVRNVTITRNLGNGEKSIIEVDARRITAEDHPLLDGDLIHVPERVF